MFFKSKSNPKLQFQNPMEIREPNFVWIPIPITVIMQGPYAFQLKDSNTYK